MLRKRPEMAKDGWKVGDLIPGRILHARYSRYMQRVAETAPWLVDQLANVGARVVRRGSCISRAISPLPEKKTRTSSGTDSVPSGYSKNIYVCI